MPLTEEQLGAVQSIDKHVLVSAGAGSGKTSVLVERFLEVLRCHPEAGVSDVIAVTFTRKAAEEMRTRLKEGLKKLSTNAQAEEDRVRWNRCLVEIESARIGTIHSLCDHLLKTRSTEAAVDPRFELLDDLERAQLLDDSVREAIAEMLDEPPQGFEELLDFPLEQVKEMLKQLLSSSLRYGEARQVFRDSANERVAAAEGASSAVRKMYSAPEHLDRIREFARTFVQKTYHGAVRSLLSQRQFQLNARYVLDNPWSDRGNMLAERQEEVCALLVRLLDSKGADHGALEQLATFPLTRAGGEHGTTLRGAIKALRNEAKKVSAKLKPELNETDELAISAVGALIELADRARAAYEHGKQLNQKLDFDDLITRTAALVESSDSQRPISMPNIRALLVDEFQDTNSIQARMLASIAAGNPTTRLFLIGDDKQSIYKFQGADVGTFNMCKGIIASLASSGNTSASELSTPALDWPQLRGLGELRSLSFSFRSHPAIVEFVNVLFHRLFDAQGDAEAHRSRFQALNAARDGDDDGRRIEIITFAPAEENTDSPDASVENRMPRVQPSLAQMEARLVAKHIIDKIRSGETSVHDKEQGLERKVRYGDFAILLQANGDFAVIESALGEAGIPYISFAGAGYLDRQEILDMENLLKWLLAPQDGHALLAALRSPVFGISDDVIHDLKTRTAQSSLWYMLRQTANAERDPVLLRCVTLLRDWLYRAGECSVEELVRNILTRSGIDIVLPAVPGGKQRARNLWKFVNLAARHNHLGLRGFLLALQAMRDNGVKNLTDAPLTSDDAVKIMTVHKSKGLEFGVVILPRMARKVHGHAGRLLFGKEFGLAIDPTRDSEETKPAFFRAVDSFNRALDEEEKKRLLYVALTRARDHLVLLLPTKSATSVSFAKWLRDGLSLEDLEGVLDQPVEGSASSGGRTSRFTLRSMTEEDLQYTAAESIGESEAHRIISGSMYGPPSSNAENGTLASPGESTSVDGSCLIDTSGGGNEYHERELLLQQVNLDLLEPLSTGAGDIGPVPWQALVRTTPSVVNPSVHATIVGSYFHLLMDRLSQSMEMVTREVMLDLLVHPEVGVFHETLQQQLLSEGEKLLAIFVASPLIQQMKTARRRIHETSYFTTRNGQPQAECRPDLLLEDIQGNWSIVDYKTDHFPLPELARQAKQHRAQLVGYADDFQKITGIEPRSFIYFAQHGTLHELDCLQPVQLKLI